jgi:hypothetical protein
LAQKISNKAYENHSSFHHGLLITKTQQKRKRNSEKYTGNIFGVFGFSKRKSKLKIKGKTKMRKTIYTGKLPISKRRTRKSFWFFS